MLAVKDWDSSLQESALIEPPSLEDIMIYTVREDRQNKSKVRTFPVYDLVEGLNDFAAD